MKTAVRLVDGARELIIHPSLDIVPQSLDVASPAVREVTEPRTDDDGERDSTLLFGARAVSLTVAVVNERAECEQILDSIKAFLHPRARPYLYVTDDGWAQERRIRLRVDQWADPYEGYVASQHRPVQLQWRAPDGVWEAADLTVENVSADIVEQVGVSFPLSFPMSWPTTTATGASILDNLGITPSHFVARLYGPCTAPRLINQTTGEQVAFTEALVLASGDYVEIDTRARTADLTLNGAAAAVSRLNAIDFTTTSWWRIEPGENEIRYAPLFASGAAAAVIEYRPAWL